MRRYCAIALALGFVAAGSPAQSDVPLPAALQVLGTVTSATRPVASALVIALNLNNFDASQTFTVGDGSFSLPALPAGIYRIIAVKPGFLPAIATVLPTRADQRVNLRLESQKVKGRSVNDVMWEIRGSLPPEILRDLDFYLGSPEASASQQLPRISGEMVSMTGLADQTANPAFAQTALGVKSRIGERWQIGIRGDVKRFDDPADSQRFGPPVAQSSVMSMELRSSPTDRYRVASTMSSWRYRDGSPAADLHGDVRAHNFEWQHGDANVQVRYLNQQNLDHARPMASELIEIGGGTTVLQTGRSDLGVTLRVTQESLRDMPSAIMRRADLAANASFALVPSLLLHYGMASRLGLDGTEWAPRTGAEWKITKHTSVVGSATYKVLDRTVQVHTMPTLVVFSDDTRAIPRYAYSIGLVSGGNESNRLSAIATVTETDSPMRVVFNDGFEQFWDGLYIETGDIRRDVRVAYRREVGNRLAVDVSTSAGTATDASERQKVYVTGDFQSTFIPTGTTLAISYREIQQPRENKGSQDYRSERVNIRMAQSLYLPVDVKLLVGVEVARAQNSPYLVDAIVLEGLSKKYIGGLALNF